jgi:multiple sugar transport system ATP-binding protein
MYQGKIEQVGTPMEVYRNSATRFVASFIGTPPTNFFDLTPEKNGSPESSGTYSCRVRNQYINYTVPPSRREKLEPYEGKKIVLGIRPEFIRASPGMERGEGYLCDTVIRFVEPQGSYSILIADVGGEEIKILSYENREIPVNTPVSLSVKDEEVMFFDPGSGLRIG